MGRNCMSDIEYYFKFIESLSSESAIILNWNWSRKWSGQTTVNIAPKTSQKSSLMNGIIAGLYFGLYKTNSPTLKTTPLPRRISQLSNSICLRHKAYKHKKSILFYFNMRIAVENCLRSRVTGITNFIKCSSPWILCSRHCHKMYFINWRKDLHSMTMTAL